MAVVTEAHLRAAKSAGACENVSRYRPGMALREITQADLAWFAQRFPDEAKRVASAALRASGATLRGAPPLEFFGYGSGSGSGSGDGSGYGYGYGDGSG